MSAETYSFKSEAQQLLDLMIHSLYSNKEIFLRELISNASDALDKLRFEALTRPELRTDDTPLRIRLSADPEARTLTVEDNGVGMTRDEAIHNLGTIAHSGTREFTRKLAEAKQSEAPEALIGQFGVGFYSSFMVADRVTVVTRAAGTTEATRWSSSGDGTFSVEAAERETPGTTITLNLRPADTDNNLPDFTDEWAIKRVVKKYSDFVTYPIELRTTREESERDEEGDEIEGTQKTIVEWKTINSMKAIWTRSPAEVSDDEYAEFYKHISRDWEPPLDRITLSAEGQFEYRALLFVPQRQPFDLFYRDSKWGLQLYVNRVLIMEHCEDLIPEWLRFMRGVVESPDLSLNVSREILQQDRRVNAIRKKVVKKVLDGLAKLRTDDAERYGKFWENFGRVLKEGITDTAHTEKLADLFLFASSNDASKPTSLADYIERMKDGQDAIYYLTGESRAVVERSPHLEAFCAKGYEVLYLTDPVDEILVTHLTEFRERPLKSVGKGEVELGTEEEKQQAEEARKAKEETHGELLKALQGHLDEHIKEVRLSNRLTTSPACLVGEEHDLSPGLERLLAQANQSAPKSKRILELNADHAVFERLAALQAQGDETGLRAQAVLLHGLAQLSEGSPLADPGAFGAALTGLMAR